MKIVIVEDEINIREGIKTILIKLNKQYEVVGEADNGEDGISIIKALQPDAVITDIRMDGMDGLEMIQHVKAEGISAQFIVISAYSEFEYARTAMKLGVTEYLLKPIGLTDLLQSLESTEMKVHKEHQQKPEKIGTLEHVLRDFLEGTIKFDDDVRDYLFHKYEITENTQFMILCAYIGKDYKDASDKIMRELKHIFSLKDFSASLFSMQERNSIIAVIYNFDDASETERYIQRQLLSNGDAGSVYGCTVVNSITELESGFQKLYPFMDWNISFQDDILISYPKILNVQTAPCIYPIETETACKVAVCSNDIDKVRTYFDEFQESFHDGKLYAPKEIKECYIRFVLAITGIAKEIGMLHQDQFDQQKLLEIIVNARRKEDLSEIIGTIIDALFVETDINVTHLTVKRVLNMIHEFYHTGITLEQISDKLNVTPEYIGTQFHKEVGVTFSTYIRNYRINKAKELLCSTDLKLYEIAEKTGYSDSKYFSKVFKEVTGQLPAEYRKTYK